MRVSAAARLTHPIGNLTERGLRRCWLGRGSLRLPMRGLAGVTLAWFRLIPGSVELDHDLETAGGVGVIGGKGFQTDVRRFEQDRLGFGETPLLLQEHAEVLEALGDGGMSF